LFPPGKLRVITDKDQNFSVFVCVWNFSAQDNRKQSGIFNKLAIIVPLEGGHPVVKKIQDERKEIPKAEFSDLPNINAALS
jgi:hypothetical protein